MACKLLPKIYLGISGIDLDIVTINTKAEIFKDYYSFNQYISITLGLNILFQKLFQLDAFIINEYKWHLNARNAINNSKRKGA